MKILIVSDTHRRDGNLTQVLDMVGQIDLLIHCGDVEGSEAFIKSIAGCPVHMVAGNNDFFTDLAQEEEFEIGKYRVWLTHGHHYYVSVGTEAILEDYANPDSHNYHEMLDEIGKQLNFTSLRYHRLDDMVASIGLEPCKVCTYCFDGKE